MQAAAPTEQACAWAHALLDGQQSASAARTGLDAAQRLAVAWALKDLCYAAWSTEPQRAAKAADTLKELARALPAPAASPGAQAGQAGNDDARADAEVQAVAEWTSGIAHVTRGRMVEAVAALDRAHEGFERLGRAQPAAATRVPCIMVLSMLGQYEEAIACAEGAQRRFVELGDRAAAAKVSVNLGGLHLLRGGYAQAVRHSREAAVLFARVRDHEHSVRADINMAHALSSMGDFDEALRIYARAAMRAAAHAFPVLQAMVEEAVAGVHLARGQYGDALAGFEGARRRYEDLAMPQELAVAERQLADAYLELHLLPEAQRLLDESLARFRSLDRPDGEAWTLVQCARVRALLGKGDAPAHFERAAKRFAEQGNAAGEAAVLLARGELELAAGHVDAALELSTHAGQAFAKLGQIEAGLRADVLHAHALLAADRIEPARGQFAAALARSQSLGLLTLQVRCLTGCGLAELRTGAPAQAEAHFNQAVAMLEEQRCAVPDAALRGAFLTDHLRPYQELVRLALAAPDADVAGAALVLQRLDRCRARVLGEAVAAGASMAMDSPAIAPLRARLNWLARRVEHLQAQGEPVAALVDELRQTEQALLERSRRERLSAPASSPQAAAADFDPAELQRALGDAAALVQYGVQDDELFACVVTAQRITVKRHLAPWTAVLEALRSTRFQIETLRHGAAPVAAHLEHLSARARKRLAQMHDLLWKPLAPALQGARRILVVPHGQLGALPFAALADDEGCLFERYELAVAPSARLALRGLQLRPPAPARALVLGETSRLPHAGGEAQAVAQLLGTEPHLGKEATIARLRAAAATSDVIHIACHGQFRSDNPTFSALHLHDGALSVDLVETLALARSTVVLSGCETGLSQADSGDEMVGLVRAFLIAGASRVLASLWPVDDAVTARFMAHFYGALRRGEAPAAALAVAQREVRRHHPHPLYWAAFTLHGGW